MLDKVKYLRKSAELLRDGFNYNWAFTCQCNVGVLACAVCGKLAVYEQFGKYGLSIAWEVWLSVDIPYAITPPPFLKELRSIFSDKELEHLETLSERKVIEYLAENKRFPADKNGLDYDNKKDVIVYLEAWADMLEAEEASAPVVEEAELVGV